MYFNLARNFDLTKISGMELIPEHTRFSAGIVLARALIERFGQDSWVESVVFTQADEYARKCFNSVNLVLITVRVSKRESEYDPFEVRSYKWGTHEDNKSGMFEAKGYYTPGDEGLLAYVDPGEAFNQDMSLTR